MRWITKPRPINSKKVTGVDKYNEFTKTLDLLCAQKAVPFEVRTTVHTDLMDEDDVNAIIHDLENRGYQGTHAHTEFHP
ncbi:MAG: hypothetical protein H6857_03115 [Rhodospirillales bacterium]|nr:hypothetical protein [Rhodospirillales bacterium]